MAGRSTGQPNSDSYNLGRGALYFAEIDSTTGLPKDYRHLGNAPAFSVTVDSETLEHQSSLEGLKTVDKEVVISQSMSTSLTLDEINFDNLAVFLSGTPSSGAQDTTALANRVLHAGTPPLARWYDVIDADGDRVYDLPNTITISFATPGATMVEGTDYTVDRVMGRIYLISLNGGSGDLQISLTPVNTNISKVAGLNKTTVAGALKFIGKNPANSDDQVEYQFHKISLKAEGEFNLISDDWTQMQFTGKAEKNTGTSLAVNGKTLTVSSYAVADQLTVG